MYGLVMFIEAVDNIDEAVEGGGKARYEDYIELKYPGAADKGGDKREGVATGEEYGASNSRGLRTNRERVAIREGGGKYEKAGAGQLGSSGGFNARTYPISIEKADTVAAALQYHSVWSLSL